MSNVTTIKNHSATGGSMTTATPAIMAGLATRYAEISRIAVRRSSEETRDWLRHKSPLTHRREIETARKWVNVIPDRETLDAQQESLWEAIFKPASEQETRIVIAAIIGAINHASATAGQAFIESLIFSILHVDDDVDSPWRPSRGFSLPVLYVAARRIIAKAKFCPSIAEIISEAELAREMFMQAMRATDRLNELRLSADDLIELVDDPIVVNPADGDNDGLPE